MTAKTRYFLIGSVMVLVVGLSIGLVAFYGGMPSGFFSAQREPAELKYMPKDAAVVAYANVRDVMNSELGSGCASSTGPPTKAEASSRPRRGSTSSRISIASWRAWARGRATRSATA
jgi:hypothetical protein